MKRSESAHFSLRPEREKSAPGKFLRCSPDPALLRTADTLLAGLSMRDGVPVEVMTDTEQLNALNTTVNSYLGVLAALSDCVGVACPEVGIAYRNRLSRMRSRLAF